MVKHSLIVESRRAGQEIPQFYGSRVNKAAGDWPCEYTAGIAETRHRIAKFRIRTADRRYRPVCPLPCVNCSGNIPCHDWPLSVSKPSFIRHVYSMFLSHVTTADQGCDSYSQQDNPAWCDAQISSATRSGRFAPRKAAPVPAG